MPQNSKENPSEVDWKNVGKNLAEISAWMIGMGVSGSVVANWLVEFLQEEISKTAEEKAIMVIFATVLSALGGLVIYIDNGTWRPIRKHISNSENNT